MRLSAGFYFPSFVFGSVIDPEGDPREEENQICQVHY